MGETKKYRRVNGYYNIDGILCPSVTTILGEMLPSPGLDIWKKRTNNYKKIQNDSRVYGNFMHYRIQAKLTEIPPDPPTDCIDDWPEDLIEVMKLREEAFDKLGLEFGKPVVVEKTVYRTSMPRCAGSLDIKAPVHGIETIVDLKSSKKPQKKHRYQVAAYAWMANNMNLGKKVEQGMIIYIPNGTADIVWMEKEELEEDANYFFDLAEKYHTRHSQD